LVELLTNELFEKVKAGLPADAEIAEIRFEGSEIVIYTKSRDFFGGDNTAIRELVGQLKKRIHLRPHVSILSPTEEAEKAIAAVVPEEAGIKELVFQPEFGIVNIEAEKPGLVIGKGGETLREIRATAFWAPVVKRAPVIPSDVIKTLRELIYKEASFRKDWLDKVGRRIHSGWKATEWVTLTALGAFREVGRSCVLIRTPESRILMDCGVKPGTNEYPMLNLPEAEITKLDAVILSHAHMDHAGMIPFLYEMGCEAPLYCTTPTRDLMVMMTLDFLDIAQREGRPAPYTSKGIKEAVKHCITLDMEQVTDIAPDVRLTLLNDGHILGGALVHLHIGEGFHNLLYTGDLKFDRTALFDPASTNFSRAETIITESTYGLHEDIQPRRFEAEGDLVDIVAKTVKRGGKVLLPSFAVERSQDIQVILANAGIDVPVYLDGMVWDVSAITTAYPEFLGRDLQRAVLQQNKNPFTSPVFRRIGSQEERKKVFESEEPCVIIATSGMLIGGPSVWWLRQLAEDKRNTLVFVGYQAEGTLGRKVAKGWKEVPIEEGGRTKGLPINMEVTTVEGLSGHSDYKQLLNFISKSRTRPELIIVNHGDPVKCVEFARAVHRIFKVEAIAPKLLETIRLR
jgi:KH/beta-lactamase-domain protein